MVFEVGTLDQKMLRIHLSVARVSLASTLFTSRPVTTAFSKPSFRAFIGLLAFMVVILVVGKWSEFYKSMTTAAQFWRFTVLERRNATLAHPACEHANSSSSILIIFQDLALPSQPGWNADCTEAKVELKTIVTIADEWCFRTDMAESDRDPVRFQLHVSNDNSDWRQVASSTSFLDMMAGIEFFDGFFNTPDARGRLVCFPMARHMRWDMFAACGMTLQLVCTVGATILAGYGHEDTARKLYASSLAAVGYNLLSIGFGGWWTVNYSTGVKFLLASIVPCIWSFFIFFREHQFVRGIVLSSVVDISINVWRYDGDVGHMAWLVAVHGAVLVWGSWVWRFKARAMDAAKQVVEADRSGYDAAWETLRGQRAELDGLYRLQTLVRQRFPVEGRVVQVDAAGRAETSLDALYRGAAAASPQLRRRVLEWGCKGRGMLQAEEGRRWECRGEGGGGGGCGLVKCEEVEQLGESGARVGWARLKDSHRSIEKVRAAARRAAGGRARRREEEKGPEGRGRADGRGVQLYRAYNGEVAGLADLCRERIVFRTAQGLLQTLREMLAGERAGGFRVLRIKNGFDPARDAEGSAGFRSVLVNVELRSAPGEAPEWVHACEVQLHLLPFYVLQSAAGHRRYVQFRSAPSR